ncbi:family 78 glycoside hydrolase catalytic domain (plasmid) [Rathayibacter sp. VKM Ac-2803]|uniref:alpha-L-rhamnosidase n=2 Tax=Microbacteriaceae TaxID=85023 RepID=A0A2T4UNQ5_9MICO|nr:family 78 glycoside hydrolase catalytic domain [Rathayibacter sp. VKM Ac-2803]PTL71168.1 alpha-L-rhamnosidase [Rathayibacter caricis DSM 15933]
MIAAEEDFGSAPLLRRTVALESGHGAVVDATIFATALGLCEIRIDGTVVTEDVLTPGWSSYEWRLRYARWEVGALLRPTFDLAILLGNGWHTGRLGFVEKRALYGEERAAWLVLLIRYEDGHEQTVVTDESWRSGPSDVLADDLYDGQTIDAGLRDEPWSAGTQDAATGRPVVALPFDQGRLTPYIGPPVRRQEEVAPVSIWAAPSGATLLDFGQNLVGWIRLTVQGTRGSTIRLRHAEVLEHGELGVRPLRTAAATDRFVLSGGRDDFEPTFTFHGFRYAEITGWAGSAEELATALTAVVVSSDLERIGWFECSDPLLSRLHSNVVWSMRGNFLDVPSDCPQRDERLGWTGDLSAFVETGVVLYDVGSFLEDWLADLAVEQQHADGMIPLVVPDNFKLEKRWGMTERMKQLPYPIAALWHDAAAWVPWAAWRAYGRRPALESAYSSMASYARRIALALDSDGILRGLQFGDWLDPDAPADEPSQGKADPFVVATACVYRSARIVESAARELGRATDAAEFAATAERIGTAFRRAFLRGDRLESDAPTVYALAIAFGLVEGEARQAAGDRLAELVREAEHVVTTGFAGTPFIAGALTDTGHLDDAYRLVLQTECPSWLFPVTMGATTIWERWDSMLPDGSINPGEMTSFNHYASGAIGQWLHEVVGGLAPLEPGYRRMRIAPRPGGELRHARLRLRTPFGDTEVSWAIEGDTMTVDATVPPGCSAHVELPQHPDPRPFEVSGGVHSWRYTMRSEGLALR